MKMTALTLDLFLTAARSRTLPRRSAKAILNFQDRIFRGEASEPAGYSGMAIGDRIQCSGVVGHLACDESFQVLVQDDLSNSRLSNSPPF
ncbi:hypothetical protein RB195_013778 [Necator americanus]|uniref:MCM OB domain-containing protein n=1 Tax=Necator americanus TaxID=51031 RepID=A0ABR1DXJ5_NECAM